jgi:hypothetical protein
MFVRITLKNFVAFLLFALLMGESHEIAHFLVGKVVCGCWPETRDFNAWTLCASCEEGNPYEYLPTAAGPLFSMTLAWVGMFLLWSPVGTRQSLGLVLTWANVPQARLMTVLMEGGDEYVVTRSLAEGTTLDPWWLAVVWVAIMTVPPMISSFFRIKNRSGWAYSVGFMIFPLLVLSLYGFGLLNTLLERGFLAQIWIMGTPLFITLHTLAVLVVLLVWFRKDLFTFSTQPVS